MFFFFFELSDEKWCFVGEWVRKSAKKNKKNSKNLGWNATTVRQTKTLAKALRLIHAWCNCSTREPNNSQSYFPSFPSWLCIPHSPPKMGIWILMKFIDEACISCGGLNIFLPLTLWQFCTQCALHETFASVKRSHRHGIPFMRSLCRHARLGVKILNQIEACPTDACRTGNTS